MIARLSTPLAAMGALVAGLACSPEPGHPPDGDPPPTDMMPVSGDQNEHAPPGDTYDVEWLAGSIFLGQVYQSGRLYLEAFGDLGNHRAGLAEWPAEILFLPLDDGARRDTTENGRFAVARYHGTAMWVYPPAAEGMPEADSPCVSADYQPAAGARYFALDATVHAGQAEDYFATMEWFDCGAEPSVPIYQTGAPMEASFRVIAFRPELEVVAIDHSIGGYPRPLTALEAEEVTRQRTGDGDCTLEPRRLDEARQLVRLTTRRPKYDLRISSHIEACTSIAEVFVLDVLEDDQFVQSLRTARWRGNP